MFTPAMIRGREEEMPKVKKVIRIYFDSLTAKSGEETVSAKLNRIFCVLAENDGGMELAKTVNDSDRLQNLKTLPRTPRLWDYFQATQVGDGFTRGLMTAREYLATVWTAMDI